MPFITVKLVPGVHAEQTPLLLQAGVIQSNNVRWRDGLPEKIGGWKKFIPQMIAGPVRELWTWADLNGFNHLATAGGSNVSVITGATPSGITNPTIQPVAPVMIIRNPTSFSTTAGSPLVVVTDTGSNANTYESVTLQTPVGFAGAGGFAIPPGTYPIVAVGSANSYTINIGVNATITATGGTPATITSIANSAVFTAALANHGFSVGSTFAITLPTTIGGTVLSGFYTVAAVADSGHFSFLANTQASTAQTVNYGNISAGFQAIQWGIAAPALAASTPAGGAFAVGAWGIAMPAGLTGISPGMKVTDVTTGQILGTVSSYGPVTVTQTANQAFSRTQTTIDMTPNTASPGIIPGMAVLDVSVYSPSQPTLLGYVQSYVGNTLTVVRTGFAGIPGWIGDGSSSGANDQLLFCSGNGAVVTAAGSFTNQYFGIPASPLPSGFPPFGPLIDRTTGQFLGAVSFQGAVDTTQAAHAWNPPPLQPTFINMGVNVPFSIPGGGTAPYTGGAILPGFTAVVSGISSLGTVVSYTVTLDSSATFGYDSAMTPSSITFGASAPLIEFSSGGQNILSMLSCAVLANGSAGDSLLYGACVLTLTAPVTSASSGSSDTLSFSGGPSPPPTSTTSISAQDWCMFNFGSTLLINPQDGPIFHYDPTQGLSNAQIIANGPAHAHGMFLAMPQQMVVAYGASVLGVQDPMLVAWSDAGNYNTWGAQVNNQAGTFRLSRGSKIIGGMQIPMQAMLWTDVGLWLMTYIGYPDVWGFSEIAQECGLIAKKAAGVLGSQVFWMGKDKFWTFTGGQVQPLPCEVWDAIFQNLNTDLIDLIRCGTDTAFDGIGWFFPSLATKQPGALQENDSYVKFNRVTGEWDYGTPIDIFGDGNIGGAMISDMIDANVYGNPISAMTDSTGTQTQLMWMNMGQDAAGAPLHWWIRTGLFMLSDGEDFLFVDRCRPDFKYRKFSSPTSTPSAQVQFTLYSQEDSDNPLKPAAVYGPFTVSESSGPFDPRARGRFFSFKVEGDDLGSFARLGAIKFRFSPDGRAG